MSGQIVDWLESAFNSGSDRWMVWHRRFPWGHRLVIAPIKCIRPGRVAQMATWCMAYYIVFAVLILALVFGVVVTVRVTIFKPSHFPMPFLQTVAEDYTRGIDKYVPWELWALKGSLTLSLIWSIVSAYFWNRRARRLQAKPVLPAVPVSNPGVWPPPPQIVD